MKEQIIAILEKHDRMVMFNYVSCADDIIELLEVAEMPTEEEMNEEANNYGKRVKENLNNNYMDYGVEENASLDFLRGASWFRNRMSKPNTGGEDAKGEYVDKSISIDQYMEMNPKLDPHEQDDDEEEHPTSQEKFDGNYLPDIDSPFN